jgi:hypothetical protein
MGGDGQKPAHGWEGSAVGATPTLPITQGDLECLGSRIASTIERQAWRFPRCSEGVGPRRGAWPNRSTHWHLRSSLIRYGNISSLVSNPRGRNR